MLISHIIDGRLSFILIISVPINVWKMCRRTGKIMVYSVRIGGNKMADLRKTYPRTGDPNGGLRKRMSQKHGIIRGILTLEMMYGLGMKRLF